MKWITRERQKIGRIACPWLIHRFIDHAPEFLYMPKTDVPDVANRTGAISYGRLHLLVGTCALGVLQGCASFDPQAEACPDLSGRYHSRAEQEPDSLLVYLLESRASAPTAVVLQSNADGLLVNAGDTKKRLAHPEDYTCKRGAELLLTRQPTTHLKLPPLIDQSVVRSYAFRRTPAGDLALDVHAQSISRPYGVKLSGPVTLEKTIVWKKL